MKLVSDLPRRSIPLGNLQRGEVAIVRASNHSSLRVGDLVFRTWVSDEDKFKEHDITNLRYPGDRFRCYTGLHVEVEVIQKGTKLTIEV